MSNTELLQVVDEFDNLIDPLPRSIVHRDKQWHRTVAVWVIDDQKRILCHKRSMSKDIRPGFWSAFFGEHLAAGEGNIEGAVRAVAEELGYTISESDLIPYPEILKSDKATHKEFQQCFGLVTSSPVPSFQFDKHEIERVEWEPAERLIEILMDTERSDWVHKSWDRQLVAWLLKVAS